MKLSIRLLLISIFTIMLTTSCNTSSRAKLTIKVIDESGNIISDANVSIGFMRDTREGAEEAQIANKVDADGIFVAESNTNGIVGATITKQGFYDSSAEYRFQDKSAGRWKPWNPVVTVVMRKIENPIPMYARKAEIQIPAINKEIGFDLVEYDWIQPYGNGKHVDFIFKIAKKYVSRLEFNGTLTISTPNKFDGIKLIKENRRDGSMFKLPRNAGEEGYEKKIVKTLTAFPGKSIKSDSEEDNNYIFRVRSEQKDGKLNRAMYGKIQGDFDFMVGEGKTARIGFKYYLNPDYTRNLEFDPKKNLFKGLSALETVGLD